ncbi:hypothetical protein [Latilactobacillus sakei]
MAKLTLDEKYRKLSDCINSLKSNYLLSEVLLVAGRKLNNLHPETAALIAKIYLADEIEFIEAKYKWRLKSDKFRKRYIGIDILDEILFFEQPDAANKIKESEFKRILKDTGLPFDAFEKASADD